MGLSKVKKLTKNCDVCRKEFITLPSHNSKFCSRQCSYISKVNKITKNCKVCQREFTTKLSEDAKFCSQKCWGVSMTTEFKDISRIKQLTEATIDGIDFSTIPIFELDDSSINDIFNLDVINACNIDGDISAFALKKN